MFPFWTNRVTPFSRTIRRSERALLHKCRDEFSPRTQRSDVSHLICEYSPGWPVLSRRQTEEEKPAVIELCFGKLHALFRAESWEVAKKTVQETPGLARQMGTESCIIHQLGKVHFLSLLAECTEERFGKKFLNEWEPYSVSPGSLCCFIALRLRAWKGIIYPRDSSKWKG